MDQNFDLFGDPVDPHHGSKGRPRHKPSPEYRNRVMVLLSFDWSDERIANALGISKPTLRKHYFSELEVRVQAKDKVAAAHMSMIWSAARAGNVAAMKEFSRLQERHAIEMAEAFFDRLTNADEVPVKPLGKKEAADLEAETAGEGTRWGALLSSREHGRPN